MSTPTHASTTASAGTTSTATVATLTIPAADFALRDTIAALDGVAFDLERVVAHESERVMPLVWASGAERSAFERAFDDDPSVAAFDLLAALDDEHLYHMEWTDRIEALVHLLVEENGTILAAASANGQWHLRLLVPERGALARTHEVCKAAGLTVDIARIYALDEGRDERYYGLTDEQREAIALAAEHGYYEIPRETTAQDIADDIGISHQALSERIRRGHGNLIGTALAITDGIERETGDTSRFW